VSVNLVSILARIAVDTGTIMHTTSWYQCSTGLINSQQTDNPIFVSNFNSSNYDASKHSFKQLFRNLSCNSNTLRIISVAAASSLCKTKFMTSRSVQSFLLSCSTESSANNAACGGGDSSRDPSPREYASSNAWFYPDKWECLVSCWGRQGCGDTS